MRMSVSKAFILPLSLACLLSACRTPEPPKSSSSVTVGLVRVQLLNDSLVRLETKGPNGFEDRATFHVVERHWPSTAFTTRRTAKETLICTHDFVVHVPNKATSLNGVRVESSNGTELYRFDGQLENRRWLPGPTEQPQVWWFADTPRIVPPLWGLTPEPNVPIQSKSAGWDLKNNAADVYVFLPRGDYRQLRRDFLKLTGPTEMPPLYALGAWDSRWFDYSETTALQQIDDYRARQIPLDVLVVDTGWRIGASVGYQVNTNLFPDVERFFQEAHVRHAKVMFNDHPEPRSTNALAAEELAFRFAGLSGLLEKGLDVWWFDRNWSVALRTPSANLRKEVWGMRLYHDVTEQVKPELRPLIMANVDGIDNGRRHRPPDIAAHRFPIQWTGDTGPSFADLQRGVENCVYEGVAAAFPYMSEDLGGHTADPKPETFIRWLEYGALSPVYRPHCTHNHQRMPWAFGQEAEQAARQYLNLRYRLLPAFYAACRENFESGEPLLRRLDLDFPEFNEAKADDQYLIGKTILVAPILTNGAPAERSLWIPPGAWMDAWTGKTVTGPAIVTNVYPLQQIPLYIKAGAVIALAPEMQFTGEKPWNPITLDVYPGIGMSETITLYEDDTLTTAYQRGQFRKTHITSSDDAASRIPSISIDPAEGNFPGALAERSWVLRLHRPVGTPENPNPPAVTLNGQRCASPVKIPRNESAMPLGDKNGAPDGDVYEMTLPTALVTQTQHILLSW